MAKFGKVLFWIFALLAVALAAFAVFLFFDLPSNAPDFVGPNEAFIFGMILAGLSLSLGFALRWAFVHPAGIRQGEKWKRYLTPVVVIVFILLFFAKLMI